MYEGISLNQLSLFPDVEEVMLNYFEMIKLCIALSPKDYSKINQEMVIVREFILNNKTSRYSIHTPKWSSIEERNYEFNSKLTILYNNISMGELRNESTVYGRMLSLRFKTLVNEHILALAFPDFDFKIQQQDDGPNYPFHDYFVSFEISKDRRVENRWKDYFINIKVFDPDIYLGIDFSRLFLLEFLIKDSIFCLTEILESVTPYTTTTLFTDAFMAEIYYRLYMWSNLFEELFLFYKSIDSLSYRKKTSTHVDNMNVDDYFENYDLLFNKNSYVRKFNNFLKKFKDFNVDQISDLAENYCKIWNCHSISARFYHSVVNTIKNPICITF